MVTGIQTAEGLIGLVPTIVAAQLVSDLVRPRKRKNNIRNAQFGVLTVDKHLGLDLSRPKRVF